MKSFKRDKLTMKRAQTVKLKVTIRRVAILSSCFIIISVGMFVFFNLGTSKEVMAGNETLATGSFIIDMGKTPQTYANGLKPYGMIFEFINTYKVPVKWVINQSKVRDGIDFTYNAVNYSGGPFIIEAGSISSALATRITYWQGQGVQGSYTTSPITVPVYATLTVFPTVTIDNLSNKQSIIAAYYSNAAIPTTAYNLGDPSTLTGCIDIWTNPHGDPTWATHSSLYQFVTTYKSWIWAECHSVSVMEGCKETVSPFRQLNFLTTTGLQCYSNNKCGAITETHSGSETSPYFYNYPTDPIMQFISDMHQAATGGSEDWYIPLTTSAWNSNTKVMVNTSDGSGSRKGVKLVYGPAYNNPANGYVMYEAGHDVDGSGTTAQKVAAQRAYFNFLLTAGISKSIGISSSVPISAYEDDFIDISAAANGGSGTYTYQWTSQLGATFAPSTVATTKYKVPKRTIGTSDVVTVAATDNCNRVNFISKVITITSTLPIKLKSFKAHVVNNGVLVEWETAAEINNDNFSIERSTDGVIFSEIGKVKGAGNSTIVLDYSLLDENPLAGVSYYRLKQTDYDGKFEVFNPVSVNMKEKSGEVNSVHVYPNPFLNTFTADIICTESKDLEIQIISYNSQVISSEKLHVDAGKNTYQFSSPTELNTGIYILRIISDAGILANTKVFCRGNN
jgi:hypothetical protein